MHEEMICQGRSVSASELRWLQSWFLDQKEKSRHCLALGFCKHWQWWTATGLLKNYVARSFLLKLERRGLIELPPVRKTMCRRSWFHSLDRRVDFVPEPLLKTVSDLIPIKIIMCSAGSPEESLFRSYPATHHYLGFGKTVGENLQYLVQDQQGRDLACLLFGAAAWKVQDRDRFIGWDDGAMRLNRITPRSIQ